MSRIDLVTNTVKPLPMPKLKLVEVAVVTQEKPQKALHQLISSPLTQQPTKVLKRSSSLSLFNCLTHFFSIF